MSNRPYGSAFVASRNLVICCDGTNNEFGVENTNVVRLVQVLDRNPERQRLYYDPGVGTLPEPSLLTKFGKTVSRWVGLAFGSGLTSNIEDAYSWLMDTWEPGDKVFMFGFSRGAYTARVLAGLLHSLGLLPRHNHNLVPYVTRLFKAVRSRKLEGQDGQSSYWRVSNAFRWTFARPVHEVDDARRFPIDFLGIWDTVASVGWVWDPPRFPYSTKNPSIKVIRHAVSIDERRWFFRQNLMQPADGQDLQQVWFPGVHADVGGGYPEEGGGLWRPAFEWILREALLAGLHVDKDRLTRVLSRTEPPQRPWAEGMHESLTLRWWPAEFFPKLQWQSSSSTRVPRLGLGRRRQLTLGALIGEAALHRIREETVSYSPQNLPRQFLEKVRSLPSIPPVLPLE